MEGRSRQGVSERLGVQPLFEVLGRLDRHNLELHRIEYLHAGYRYYAISHMLDAKSAPHVALHVLSTHMDFAVILDVELFLLPADITFAIAASGDSLALVVQIDMGVDNRLRKPVPPYHRRQAKQHVCHGLHRRARSFRHITQRPQSLRAAFAVHSFLDEGLQTLNAG